MLTPALATVVTYFNQKVPARLDIADGTGIAVPPERDARLAATAAELEKLGYAEAARVVPGDPAANQTAYARVLVDRAEATAAWVLDIVQGTAACTYVELITEWEDGTAVSTLNSPFPSIFVPVPRVRQRVLSSAAVPELVGAHRQECLSIGGRRLDPSQRDPIAVAQAQNDEVLAHQERCGILRRRGADYAFTFRGARESTFRIWRASKAAAQPRAPLTGS